MKAQIIVLDTGGQYCHLIARRVRELGVSSEVKSVDISLKKLLNKVKGIIISGGPYSVYNNDSPKVNRAIFELQIPILGICYGHQLIANELGGKVKLGKVREYGITELEIPNKVLAEEVLFKELNPVETVWMSHGDTVVKLPKGFAVLASTSECKVAAMGDSSRKYYGLQFHPEVVHTPHGMTILGNFVFDICKCTQDWNPQASIEKILEEIKTKTKGKNVFFLISGGVDSTVAFTLCARALDKERVLGLHIDTGFMRKNETEEIERFFKKEDYNVRVINKSEDFLKAVDKVYLAEEKRRRIGELFLKIQEDELKKLGLSSEEWMLGQGTIYPDTIESGGTLYAARIKTHHNRVDLIKQLLEEGKVVEPLSEFYKDEVREIGTALGLLESIVWKHPFPGPGLAIRCICSPKNYSIEKNRKISSFVGKWGLEAATLPLNTVGVQGDYRSYSKLLVLTGIEFLPQKMEEISTTITNKFREVNRVAYLLIPQDKSLLDFKIKESFIDKKRLHLLREADSIARDLTENSQGLPDMPDIWQFPVILIPLTLNGGESIVLRPVCSKDGMTAEYAKIPFHLVYTLSDEIMKIPGVDAVLYDITNKPPATIEWE